MEDGDSRALRFRALQLHEDADEAERWATHYLVIGRDAARRGRIRCAVDCARAAADHDTSARTLRGMAEVLEKKAAGRRGGEVVTT
jgi:hypothetical protein